MKPSIFAIHPWNCILQKSEAETVAKNIMSILFRTGDTFRELTWDEYKRERLKDQNFTESEKVFFDQVNYYCLNSERASCFSPDWKEAYEKELQLIK